MEYTIQEIHNNVLKATYAHDILESLPEWFGNPESIKEYVEAVGKYPFWAALKAGTCLGFFSGKIHYQRTGDIYVCGISPAYHQQGIGKALYAKVEQYFRENHCEYVIVKTLRDRVDYEPYITTRRFYRHLGFTELITLTEMWDEENPCLIMIKRLKNDKEISQ